MRASQKYSRGSVTLVALCLAIVIGISLASYLALCQQSLLLSTRTVQLSKARQLAETGLEEALWSLNAFANPDTSVAATAWTSISATTPTLSAQNIPWTTSASGKDKSCTIADYDLGNGAMGKVDITIRNFDGPKVAIPAPTIIVTATVTVPGMGDFKRTLTAETKPAPLFSNALGVTNSNNGRIIFRSAGLVDSWDSDYLENVPVTIPTTPHRDNNPTATSYTPYPGQNLITIPATTIPSAPFYPFVAAPANTYPNVYFNYAAVVAAPNITLNSAEIRGYAATFGNSITITGGSKVTAPPPPGTPPAPPPIDFTRVSKSAFVPGFPVATPTPSSTGNLFSLYTSDATISIGGIQYVTSLEVDGGATGITVDITEPTVIIVQGDLYMHHGGKIRVLPPNGRLEIFVQGDIRIGGIVASTAGFINDTVAIPIERNEPKRLAIYSTSTSPTRIFQYYTTLPFSGVMYSAAPNAKIEFLATNPKIYGAILANYNIEFAAGTTPEIHYDTALQYLPKGWFKGVATPFIITQLTETP